MAEIPTPDFAVPYAAPKQVKTMADVQPMAPKNGYSTISIPSYTRLLRASKSVVKSRWRHWGEAASRREGVVVTNRIDWAKEEP